MKAYKLGMVMLGVGAFLGRAYADPSVDAGKEGCTHGNTFRMGYYLGINGGVNILCTNSQDHQKINPFTGYALGIEGGYRWRQGIRLEAEVVFRNNHIESVHYLGSDVKTGGHVNSWSSLINGIFEIPGFRQWCLTPYVGVGLGYTYQQIVVHNFHLAYAGGHNGFAWQAIAGIGYWFNSRVDFALEYRFRGGSVTYLYDQTAQAAVKYHF